MVKKVGSFGLFFFCSVGFMNKNEQEFCDAESVGVHCCELVFEKNIC